MEAARWLRENAQGRIPQAPMGMRKREARGRVAGGTKGKGEKHEA